MKKSLVRIISEKLREFGLENINDNTTVTVDNTTKEVEVFDSEANSFIGKQSFCAYFFIYNVSDDLLDINLDEINSQIFMIV